MLDEILKLIKESIEIQEKIDSSITYDIAWKETIGDNDLERLATDASNGAYALERAVALIEQVRDKLKDIVY